ncbi:MAG: HEPN domain-containing protein [Gammaproteobacteria bacterium]|nr:HEPN domain-containing protein [Gammaproteobacteria bacterium]
MTTSLDEARRYLHLAADDLAAFRALADLPHIRQALAYFHAQQSIEKCLKAVLFVQGIEFRKTHDLYELADKLEKAGITLPISPRRAEKPAASCRRLPPSSRTFGGRRDKAAFPPYLLAKTLSPKECNGIKET